MPRVALLLTALVLTSALSVSALAATQTRGTFGAVLVQRLDLYEFNQTSVTPTSTFTVRWNTALDVEDARLTLYQVGAWDHICPSGDCVSTIPQHLIRRQTNACGPIHTSEGFTETNLPVASYPVTVQGLRGSFQYTLETSTGTLRHLKSYTAVYVDTVPC